MRGLHRALLAAAAAVSIQPAAWAPARAQSAGAAVLEEVIVTAERREERLQDTPIAVTAFTADDLQAHQAQNFLALGNFIPNFTAITTTASSHNVGASLRGVSSQEPALAQDPKIGFYLDGVYLAKNSGAVFDMADLERVEVLRGPQGTLYGKNTTGGAINLVTAKPTGKLGFTQALTVGDRARLVSRTSINLPEYAGVSVKFSYLRKKRDGIATNDNPNTTVRELGNQDTDALRAALRWRPTDVVTIDYAFDYTRSNEVAKPAQVSFADPSYASALLVTSFSPFTVAPDNPFRQLIAAGVVSPDRRLSHFSLDAVQPELVKVRGHNLTVSADLDGIELRSITGYRQYRSVALAGTRGAFDFDGGDWIANIFAVGSPASNGVHKRQNQVSEEVQLIGEALDKRLQYTVGAYYFSENGREESNQWDALLFLPAGTIPGINFNGLFPQQLILGPPPGGLGEFYSIRNKSAAGYGQATFTPGWLDDRLSFTAGLRYTWDRREATILDAQPNWHTSASYANWSPTGTVAFKAAEAVNLYAKVATAYNAGSIPVRAGNQAAFSIPVGPEKLIDYELGLKSEWLDRRLRLNLAAFLYDYKNLQVSDFEAGSTILVNAGKARVTGFEVELVAIPLPGLTASANYGYTYFDYRRFVVAGVDVSDSAKPNYAPRHTASGSLEYVGAPVLLGGSPLARIDLSYTSSYTFDPFNYQHTEAGSRLLLDGRIGLTGMEVGAGSLQLALWGRNLTNKQYRDFGVDFGAIGLAVNTWGEPRSFGVDAIFNY